MKGPPSACRSRSLKLEAVRPWRHRAGRQAASTTTGRVGTARRPGPGKRDGEVYVSGTSGGTPSRSTPARTWWIRAGQQRTPAGQPAGDSEAGCCGRTGGHGEGLRRSHGEVAGEELGTHPVNGCVVNVGTVPRPPYLSSSQGDSGKACRLSMAWGRGGGSVVVRGRESRPHGEGTQRGRNRGTGTPRGRR
jgi:hypothetical protein